MAFVFLLIAAVIIAEIGYPLIGLCVALLAVFAWVGGNRP